MIKLLDQATIDKIAAGEVIERPSSVVKELLENSIDAGATIITVEIKEGGLSFIRVTDNGCGIPKEEVKTAYLRHATSKIETAEDLSYIDSLGFRGEALSTIAAVSQTEMITKIPEDLIGIKYVIHGGVEIEYSEVGVPDGTTIVVRNLFFNTPARKKFLKSAMTEGSYISDLVLKLALSHPEVSFKLISNGQTKIDTSGNGKKKDTIYQLFGRDITSNLIRIKFKNENIKITGYIGKPFIARGNRGLENYFINNRYIKSNVINRAIEEGYKTFVMQHKFPFTVLYFDLAPEKCDINVHPTKMEFKYDNEKELFEVVTKAIRSALDGKEIIPKSETKNAGNAGGHTQNVANSITERPPEPFESIRKTISENPVFARSLPEVKTKMTPLANTQAEKYTPAYSALEELIEKESKEVGLIKEDGVLYTPTAQVPTNQDTPEENNNTLNNSYYNTNYSNGIDILNVLKQNSNKNTANNATNNYGSSAGAFVKKSLTGSNLTDRSTSLTGTSQTRGLGSFAGTTSNVNTGTNAGVSQTSNLGAYGLNTTNLFNNEQQVAPINMPAISAYQKTEENAQAIKEGQLSLFDDDDFLSEGARKKHRLIGQVFGTYWLIEYENNLYIMDQHAAHEKVNFERLMKNFSNKEIFQQQLMPPMIISVTFAERQAILDNYDLFMKFGFDITEFGGNEFKISAVPSNLYGIQGKDMFMEFVGSLINNPGYMSNDVFIKKLATMACKASIKGNTRISFSEADALIDELLTLENPYTCPHGRPTIISMSETELDKKFKRVL